MSKAPSVQLFQLIHALSSQERRFFNLKYAISEVDDSKCYLLFSEIYRMKEFDDPKLQHLVYGDEKVNSNKYASLKRYLYELILSSLQDYDKDESVEYQLSEKLMNIKSLYKRALYDQCRSLVKKARKIAEHYEKFDSLLELLRWEKQIAYALGDINFLNDRLLDIEQTELLYLEKIRIIHAYKNLFYRVHTAIRKYRLLENPEIKSILEEVSSSQLFESKVRTLSYTATVIYLRTESLLRYAEKDNEQFYQSSKELIELMQSRPWMLSEDISEFISANSNFVIACMSTNRAKETLQALANFKTIHPKTYDDQLKIHRQYYQGIFEYCHNTGDFVQGYEALHRHLVEKKKFDSEPFNTPGFYYAYFYMAFGSEHYEEALTYLNIWLNSEQTVDRQDLQALARLLGLIIHFELKNTKLLESLLRAASRYLNKTAKVSVFEKEFLKFIRKAPLVAGRQNLKALGKKICLKLQQIEKHPELNTFMQYFDFIAWIESKTSEKNFATLVQQRFEENQKLAK